MKYFKWLIILQVGIFSMLYSQSIRITNPIDGSVLNNISVTIKAEITNSEADTVNIEYKNDNGDWSTYGNFQQTDTLIKFEKQFEYSDDAKHNFYIRAIIKADTLRDTTSFKVSTPAEIKTSSRNPAKISPKNNTLLLQVIYSKKMDKNTYPKFEFYDSNTKKYTLEEQGTWTNDTTYSISSANVVNNIKDLDGTLKIKVVDSKNSFGTVSASLDFEKTVDIDTKSPQATELTYSPNRKIHKEDAGKLTFTITFNEEMDTTSIGDVVLYIDTSSVKFDRNGTWLDSTTYQVKNGVEVGENFPDGETAKVKVENFRDANYNVVVKIDDFKAFTFDHQKPTVSVSTSNPVVHISQKDSVSFVLIFSEEMNITTVPSVILVNPSTDTMKCSILKWSDDKKILTVTNDEKIDEDFAEHGAKLQLIIENCFDPAGNKMDKKTADDIITMDHHAPKLEKISSSKAYINRESFARVHLSLGFDEPVMESIELYYKDSLIVSETSNLGTKNILVYINSELPNDTLTTDGDTIFVRFSAFKDTYGNIRTAKTEFYKVAILDLIKPLKPVINHHIAATNMNTFLFSGTKHDDKGPVGIIINDAIRVPVVNTTEIWSYNYDISGLSDNNNELGEKYNFTIFAEDEAGNKSDVVIDSLVIDRTGPTSVEINNSLFTSPYINTSSVSFSLKNTSSEDAQFYFRENNIDLDQFINSGKFFTPGENVHNLIKKFDAADGTRNLKVYAKDTLGNKSNVLEEYTFTIDRVAPEVTNILINNKKTDSGNRYIWGPEQNKNIDMKLIVKEETAGIDNSKNPTITLISKSDTLEITSNGSWENKKYTLNFSLENLSDGIYDIRVGGIKDKADNDQKIQGRYYLEIDTQRPLKPELAFNESEIIDRSNVFDIIGTKNDIDETRVIITETLSEGIFDSTGYTINKDWEINLLFEESREYNFEIMTQDLAGNKSEPKKIKFLIDWMPPVLTAAIPYLDIKLENNEEKGSLNLLFNEPLKDVVYPSDSLYIYPKGNIEIGRIPVRNITSYDEILLAEFYSEDIVKIGEWLELGYSLVFHLAEGTVVDVAGNGNPPLHNIPFRIIAPSIINSLSDSLICFSPNEDGISDTLKLDINFNNSDEKFLNINIYDPEESGSIFSLYRHKISSDGSYMDKDSIIQLITDKNTQRVRLKWNGKKQNGNSKIPEGEYLIKISAADNPNYSVQLPMVTEVIADTSRPLIETIEPAFGDDVLKINSSTVFKVFPSEPIFIKDINSRKDSVQYLYGNLTIIYTDTSGVEIPESHQMSPKDSLGSKSYFYYEIDTTLIAKYKDKYLDILFIVSDKAGQSDTVRVKARFIKEVEKTLEYFVNYPNPFNPDINSTTFQFNRGNSSDFTLRVFDVSGMLVALENIDISGSSGNYVNVPWDGKGLTNAPLPDGVYYAVITSGTDKSKVVKILIYRKQ